MNRLCLDPDFSPDEAEEKARLISQVHFLPRNLLKYAKMCVHQFSKFILAWNQFLSQQSKPLSHKIERKYMHSHKIDFQSLSVCIVNYILNYLGL